MKHVTYKGPEIHNLGIYGHVKSGDPMLLTEREADGLRTDKRFKIHKEQPRDERLETTDENEMARRAHIEALSDPETVMRREILELEKPELFKVADKMNRSGAGIDYTDHTPRRRLVKMIVEAITTQRVKEYCLA